MPAAKQTAKKLYHVTKSFSYLNASGEAVTVRKTVDLTKVPLDPIELPKEALTVAKKAKAIKEA